MTPVQSPQSRVPAREGQTFAGGSKWVTYANFVKLPQAAVVRLESPAHAGFAALAHQLAEAEQPETAQ